MRCSPPRQRWMIASTPTPIASATARGALIIAEANGPSSGASTLVAIISSGIATSGKPIASSACQNRNCDAIQSGVRNALPMHEARMHAKPTALTQRESTHSTSSSSAVAGSSTSCEAAISSVSICAWSGR